MDRAMSTVLATVVGLWVIALYVVVVNGALRSALKESQLMVASKDASIAAMASTMLEQEESSRELHDQLNKARLQQKEDKAYIAALEASRGWTAVEGIVTAYSPYDNVSGIECDGNPNVTSTGSKPSWGTVAVDPKRIPYGSEIIIKYEDGEIETGEARDTGGAMRQADGILVDVYRDTYLQASRHGRRRATIFWKPKEEK